MDTGLKEVTGFLAKMKDLVKSGKNIFFIERQINTQALLKFNLTMEQVYKALMELQPRDYKKGPEEDYDGTNGEVWVFLHPVSGQRMYIKMKLFKINEEDCLKILSFHD